MMSQAVSSEYSFLTGGGETGALIAGFDWSGTAIGPIEGWPQSLRTALGLLLRSPVPIVMLWGPEGIMLYNDGYSEFAGNRHPDLLGSKVLEGWPEVVDLNRRVLDVCLAGGTLEFRETELLLNRTGRLEPASLDLYYSPVVDESGQPGGVIAIVIETTERIMSERRTGFLTRLAERLRASVEPRTVMAVAAEMIGAHLGVDRVGYGELDTEVRDHVVSVEIDWCAPGLTSIAGRYRLDEYANAFVADFMAGRPVVFEDVASDPRTEGTAEGEAMRALDIGAQVVIPLVKDDDLAAMLFVHSAAPRRWPPEDVAMIRAAGERTWSELARARAEQSLREREGQLSAFIAQTTAGFAQVDLSGRFTLVNDRFCEITQRPREQLLQLKMQDITHPDDLIGNVPLFERAVAEGTSYTHEKRYLRPDGSVVWVNNSVAVIRRASGGPFGVLAVTLDVTERRAAEKALRKSEESIRLAVEGAGMATWEMDLETMVGTWSATRFAILGYPRPSDNRGTVAQWLERVHPEDRPMVATAVERCFDEGIPFTLEYRIHRADSGEERWLHSYGNRIDGQQGDPDRFVGISFDITASKRAEQHQRLLINELNHRVKNTLAIVQAISHQSFAGEGLSRDARRTFEGRLAALSSAHNLLTEQNWEGASLHQVIVDGMAAYHAGERVTIDGADVPLAPKTAVSLAMAVHELATNATKYGSLSNADGRIHIDCTVEDGALRLVWRESGGPPVIVPTKRGFGSRMIERGLAAELGGKVKIDFAPAGLICTVAAPLPRAGAA
jgi:PAS domain S-box-containing protein